MSTEPVPYPLAHEPNTKKKLQSAIQFAMDRKPEGLAGLIMWLPGDACAKGNPREYASYNHPVVILSPSISDNNTVEILGMTSFGGKDLTQKFTTSRKGMNKRARYLPIEPTPPHPDTPERNVMLQVLPYSPRAPSYVDGSLKSRKSVLFSALTEYYHYDVTYGIYPRFYLDKDSYQKLAAFVGFSTVGLLHAPADPKLPLEEQLAEQLANTNSLQSSFLPNHDANIALPTMTQQAEPATAQAREASDTPIFTHSQPTVPTSPTHSGPLDLSKPVRNNIRLVLAFIALLAAGRALGRSTVGKEALREAMTRDKAMVLVDASKKLVVAVMGGLTRMAWAVVRHSGRN